MLQKIALFVAALALTMPALTAMSADVTHYNPGAVKGFVGSQAPRAGAGRTVTRNGVPGGKPNPAGRQGKQGSDKLKFPTNPMSIRRLDPQPQPQPLPR
jgi:hypothetical protein